MVLSGSIVFAAFFIALFAVVGSVFFAGTDFAGLFADIGFGGSLFAMVLDGSFVFAALFIALFAVVGSVFVAGADLAGLFADFHCFVSFGGGFFGGNCHTHNGSNCNHRKAAGCGF